MSVAFLCLSSMESVLSCRLEVDIRLFHVLCLICLHQLISFSFCGYHLVSMVANKLLWSLHKTQHRACFVERNRFDKATL